MDNSITTHSRHNMCALRQPPSSFINQPQKALGAHTRKHTLTKHTNSSVHCSINPSIHRSIHPSIRPSSPFLEPVQLPAGQPVSQSATAPRSPVSINALTAYNTSKMNEWMQTSVSVCLSVCGTHRIKCCVNECTCISMNVCVCAYVCLLWHQDKQPHRFSVVARRPDLHTCRQQD